MHLPAPLIRLSLRLSRPVFASPRLSVATKRKAVDALASAGKAPARVAYREDDVAGVAVHVVTPPDRARGTLLYLHGGGYALGSARGYRGFVGHLAVAAGMTAVVPEYSRSPEAAFPIALDEMVGVYQELLAVADNHPIVVAGDSAGGGLTLALAMRLRELGIAPPSALGLICPWIDLLADAHRTRKARRDPLITPEMLTGWVWAYAGDADPANPLISPVLGDLAGLPPIVLHSATDDPIAADSEALERAFSGQASTGILEHRAWSRRWHCFHLQAGTFGDADVAVTHLATRLAEHAGVLREVG
ncbi:alpha/beta hydrolase fold domain-containing protein [Marmoricola sp. RAF53]|uniref:alpha/beta hydrolase fold domain-containing protein n=1 Tax=Marmoricola sp. RAF53 TaxID=3233059 RepID=UPI003F96EF86